MYRGSIRFQNIIVSYGHVFDEQLIMFSLLHATSLKLNIRPITYCLWARLMTSLNLKIITNSVMFLSC